MSNTITLQIEALALTLIDGDTDRLRDWIHDDGDRHDLLALWLECADPGDCDHGFWLMVRENVEPDRPDGGEFDLILRAAQLLDAVGRDRSGQ